MLMRDVGFERKMKRYFTLILILFLVGCGGNKPYPSERLQQPAGKFSFVTPDCWYRTKLAGIAFIIVSTDADYGARPNIYVDSVEPSGTLQDVATRVTKQNKVNYESYSVSQQVDFATASGLQGLKITAGRKNKDALPLALIHYLIAAEGRIIVITCSCAEPVRTKYELIFDQTIKSLEEERKPTKP